MLVRSAQPTHEIPDVIEVDVAAVEHHPDDEQNENVQIEYVTAIPRAEAHIAIHPRSSGHSMKTSSMIRLL